MGCFWKKRCSYHHVSIGTIVSYLCRRKPTTIVGCWNLCHWDDRKVVVFQTNQGQPSFYFIFYFISYCNHILSDKDIVLTLSRIRICWRTLLLSEMCCCIIVIKSSSFSFAVRWIIWNCIKQVIVKILFLEVWFWVQLLLIHQAIIIYRLFMKLLSSILLLYAPP